MTETKILVSSPAQLFVVVKIQLRRCPIIVLQETPWILPNGMQDLFKRMPPHVVKKMIGELWYKSRCFQSIMLLAGTQLRVWTRMFCTKLKSLLSEVCKDFLRSGKIFWQQIELQDTGFRTRQTFWKTHVSTVNIFLLRHTNYSEKKHMFQPSIYFCLKFLG